MDNIGESGGAYAMSKKPDGERKILICEAFQKKKANLIETESKIVGVKA